MPRLGGLKAIGSLAPRVKVIIVSGEATPVQRMRTLALGAFDYVFKPVNVAHLLQSIDVAVGMKQLESR
jgi:DNA-binding NtrC family response regulator